MMNTRPLAIIPVYNEADILPAVLRHLERQDCDVFVLDNWSTDLTPELLAMLDGKSERWPAERPTVYDWTGILKRIAEIALERGKGRWVILHDADEIRRVPNEWSTLTLAQALEIVMITGYNAVHFAVRTFVPTDNFWTAGSDPERTFRHYRNEHVDHGLPHVKAWFQGDERVDLHTHGGHQAVFSNRYLCPQAFLLKHYPIRSQEHGERKVLKERFPRYAPHERSKRWHVQYDEYVNAPAQHFLGNPSELSKDKTSVTIVTVARSAESFHTFADSVEQYDPSHRRIVVSSIPKVSRAGWEHIQGADPRLGFDAAASDDVLFATDSVEFIGPVAEELSEIVHLAPAGIVAAQLTDSDGEAIPGYRVEARWKQSCGLHHLSCALLRRSMLDANRDFDPAHPNQPFVIARCRVRQTAAHLFTA